jgi:hypothetical protein
MGITVPLGAPFRYRYSGEADEAILAALLQ